MILGLFTSTFGSWYREWYRESKTFDWSFQDIFQLATINSQDCDDTFSFTNPMQSVIDIYTGATVYSEQVFEQGKLPSLQHFGIFLYYLLPNSVLKFQTHAESSDTSSSNCIASLNIITVTNQTGASDTSQTCISNISNYNITSYSFKEPAFYLFWINTSVPLNYTITGEAYRYNVSNATLHCSLPYGRHNCTFKSDNLRALKVNPVHIYAVWPSLRYTYTYQTNNNTISKIKYYVLAIVQFISIFVYLAIRAYI